MTPPPADRSPFQSLLEDGFCILPGLIPSEECARYVKDVIHPALRHYAGIDETDRSTFKISSNPVLAGMVTGDAQDHQDVPSGVMVRNPENDSDPIQHEEEKTWPALMQNLKLLSFLDMLHNADAQDQHQEEKERNWQWIHPDNVGWIHVRFPAEKESLGTQQEYTWHVDGGHFSPHCLDSPEQSFVVLPILRNVQVGGGNTCVLAKSHLYMTHLLRSRGTKGVGKEFTQHCESLADAWDSRLRVEVAPCRAGDVLVLHPFVIHSSTRQTRPGLPLRLTFNMGTQWRLPRRPLENDVKRPLFGMETTLVNALKRTPPELRLAADSPFQLPSAYRKTVSYEQPVQIQWKDKAGEDGHMITVQFDGDDTVVFEKEPPADAGEKLQFGDFVRVRHERDDGMRHLRGNFCIQGFCNLDGLQVVKSDTLTLIPMRDIIETREERMNAI